MDGEPKLAQARGYELEMSREERKALLHENSILRQENASLTDRWNEVERSLGWLLVQRARHLRATLFREGTIPGRCWSLSSRFIKTASRSGIRGAVRKSLDEITRKMTARLPRKSSLVPAFLARFFPVEVLPVDRFHELPWRFLGKGPRGRSRKSGYFKMLLVSHSACRTGAPLCLLRLAEELSRLADVECWVVLQQGGELADSFAAIAPTLDIEKLTAQGVDRDRVPGFIASSFHEFSSRGLAVCNTMAVSGFHSEFAQRNVSVLSWVHELPTFIESLAGKDAIERIKAASHKIMVPAEAVRTALASRFGIDLDRVRTVYNGQDARTRGLSRQTMRLRVLEELGLPDDALIVLGCGTVDLRKGADLFVNVARRVLSDPLAMSVSPRTYFVWVGHRNHDDLERWLLHDVGIGGLQDHIRFIGPRATTTPYFMAADLFALTSREDPCPLVNLEAMECGLAVVAFQGAGGASEVLGEGGVCVPYIDVDAMARAVSELLADPAVRDDTGRRGQTLIREKFTWSRFMDEFLDMLRKDFHYYTSQSLKVSVIVPNYRHARFLEERLRSVFDQTLRPHEIIFLDNASPDESVAVARRLALLAPVPMQIVVNDQNNGSTFRQWIKGLSLATGDLIWIAESDDSAHPLLLERIVPEFYDPDVVLAYCQSALIGPGGEKWSDNFLAHTDDISTTRWRARYSVPGVEEAELALSQKNTIPNASAVVFRRPVHLDFEDELVNFRFAGDWLFYAMLIRTGKIAYLPEVLNFYRRHEDTVTHRSVREDTQPQESVYVKARVFETFPVSANAIARSLARSVLEYDQLSERMNLKRPAFTANPSLSGPLNRIRANLDQRRPSSSSLKILLVVTDLEAHAESAAIIQLTGALAGEHTVFLCNARPQSCAENMVARIDERVIFLEGTLGASPWSSTPEQPDQTGSRQASRRSEILRELVRVHRIDVIHSHSWRADRLVLSIIEDLKIPWLFHLDGVLHALSESEFADPEISEAANAIVSAARGIFYEHESDFMRLEQRAIRVPSGKARWLIDRGSSIDRIAAACTESYLEACKVLTFDHGEDSTEPITYETPPVPSRRLA